jgi:hypothetical protein
MPRRRAFRDTSSVVLGLFAVLAARLLAAPTPPTNLIAHVSGDSVALAWSAPGPVLGYRLQAGTASGLSNVADLEVGSIVQLTATSVPPGT